MKIFDFQRMKQQGEKISIVTCYDHWSAKIIATTAIDCILVGDSAAMIMHGHPTTIPATTEMMVMHTQAVARGAGTKFIITDMPFLAHRKGLVAAMDAVQQLVQAGAHAVKIEGADGNLELIQHIVTSGIPVMGHLGMTAQAIHQLGGFKVQGKQAAAAETLVTQAHALQQAGCFALVLECVPPQLAKMISEQLQIPVIGIGAGLAVDGQVLVLQDLLGMNPDFKPKFLKQYMDGFTAVQSALNAFNQEVKQQLFPTPEHSY